MNLTTMQNNISIVKAFEGGFKMKMGGLMYVGFLFVNI
jgi:hypothetical protein